MGTGYVRQSSAGIVDGFVVEASDLNAEYNRLEAAFNGTTGHAHDGTTGNGPQIDLTTSVTGVLPIANGGTNATSAANARTNLGTNNASNLTSGTVADARLPTSQAGKTFTSAVSFPNATVSTNGITLNTGTSQTSIGSSGVFAREGGNINFRPNGAASSSNQATLSTSGVFSATTFSGSGASLTNLNASNLSSGTVPSARISGSYTGITGTGALNAGSITSGFGNINIGTSTFTGNGSGLNTLNASNLSSGTVPSARVSGAYTGITSVGNLSADLNVLKSTARIGVGGSGGPVEGVLANFGSSQGYIGLASNFDGGRIYLRPNSGASNQAVLWGSGLFQMPGEVSASSLTLSAGTNVITIGSTTAQTQIGSSGIFARNGGIVYLRPNGAGTSTGEVTVSTSGVLSADSITTGLTNVSSNSVNHGYLGRSTNNPWSFRWNGSSGTIYVGGVSGGNFVISTSSDPSSGRCFYVDGTQTIVYGTFSPQSSIQPASVTIYRQNKGTSTNPMFQYLRSNTSPGTVMTFANDTDGSPPDGVHRGSITITASATAYNTSSDERMKDFIGEYDPETAISIIRADPVRDFTWKDTGTYAVGWGAQTSYSVSPDLATPPVDEDGIWGVDQGKRTPYLWAAMSRVLDRLDELEARVAELEAKYEN